MNYMPTLDKIIAIWYNHLRTFSLRAYTLTWDTCCSIERMIMNIQFMDE